MFSVAFKRAQNFGKSERGVVLVLFLVFIVPLLILIAIAIDFSQFLVMKRQLQGATDAAALSAATSPTMSEADAKKLVDDTIAANYPAGSIGTLGAASLERICGSGSRCTSVTVTGRATLNTSFLKLAGYSALPLQVSSTAQSSSYFDIYVAVDQSDSLGIAASPADRANLQALTKPYTVDPYEKNGCEFACHQVDNGLVNLPQVTINNKLVDQNLYDFVKSYNVQHPAQPVFLREDVLNAAFSGFVSNVFATNPNPNLVRRVDVIGFSDDIHDLTNGPTGDESAAASALGDFPDSKKFNTKFDVVLPNILQLMGQQGNGSSQQTPRKMLVLITDGVDTVWKHNSYPIDMPVAKGSAISLPSPNDCGAIKDKGFILAVVDVKYVESPQDHWFQHWLGRKVNFDGATSTIYEKISPALQQCASPNWYFQANQVDDADGINGAFKQLLDQINAFTLRLTR